MQTFTIFTKYWIVYYILTSMYLILLTSGSSPAEDMNLYRYSAKRLTKKMSPSVTAVLMECPRPSVAPSCQRKIMVNVHVSPEDQSYKRQKYLLLDEIYDQKKKTRARLMSPYLIELTQGEPVLMYPLEFMKDLECKSCGGKTGKDTVESINLRSPKSNLAKFPRQMKLDVGYKASDEDELMKHLKSLSSNHMKPSYKTHYSSLQKPLVVDESDDKDTTLDLDSAVDIGSNNLKDVNSDDQPQQFEYETIHDSVKRNPKNIERLLFGTSEYDDASHSYDAMFNDLERKNEKIKKDILEILRPALQISDADLKNSGPANANQVTNNTEPAPSPAIIQQSKPSTNTSCPPCPPCPTCPPPPAAVAPPATNPKYEGSPVPVDRMERPQTVPNPNQRMMAGLYGRNRGHRHGFALAPNALAPFHRDDLPIQEYSEESSNSDETDNTSSDETTGDQGPASEEAEDIYSSVLGANNEPFTPGKQIQNVQGHSNVHLNIESKAPIHAMNEQPIEGWEKSSIDSPEVSKFTRYHLDPVRYGGPEFSKVDRYQSLLGINNKQSRYSPSPDRKNPHKKDAKFISYSNGFGLNVDSTDLLNSSYTSNFEHEPPMPRLHHYFMQVNAQACPHCGVIHDPMSSIVEVPPRNVFFKKNIKKSIPRMCPNCKPFGSNRKISTSKINPIQRVALDPGLAQMAFRDWPPTIGGMKGLEDIQANDIQEAANGGCGGQCSNSCDPPKPPPSCDPPKPTNCGEDNQVPFSLPKFSNGPRGNSEQGNSRNYQMTEEDDSSRDQDYESPQIRKEQQVNSMPLHISSNPKPSSYNWKANKPLSAADKLSGKSVAVRENVPHQVQEDGEDYDYYEEETNDLNGYPGVLTSKSKPKFPSVYQRPVYVPEVPLESEDDSSAYMEESPREQQRMPSLHGHVKGPKAHHHRQANEYGQTGMGPAEILLSQVDQSLLPDKVPYQSFMGDHNLNVADKMHLMEVIDPYDSELENLLKYLETEVQSSKIPYYITKPDRDVTRPVKFEMYQEDNRAGGHEKNIEKRSFLVYDDLEMRDTDFDYDGLAAANHASSLDNSRQSRRPHITSEYNQSGRKNVKKSIRSVEDIWYSVFNMSAPLQFLTTRVRIFRRKGNSWWKIAPSITLTSLSGIYANANLSILFSSHVEIYTLEKPLSIKNYRLLIPKNQTNITSRDILAVDKTKFHLDQIETDELLRDSVCAAAFDKSTPNLDELTTNKRKRNDENEAVHSLQDLGYFPSTMNILEQCKNDPNHLCLNMLDEETPGYKIKAQIPFRDNSLVYKDFFKVRITSITADGTINGAVQIVVGFINEALVAQGFDVLVANCPVTCGEKNVVHKVAPPHRGVTVAFLLPMQDNDKTVKHRCEVQIKTSSNLIVSRRSMIVQPSARCLCIWQCHCQCVKEYLPTSSSDMCHHLTYSEETDAGFEDANMSSLSWQGFVFWIGIFLMLLLLFGCVKGCLGCFLTAVGSWKYNYLQPMKKYDEASRCRRFFINSLFFLCFPFVCLCRCFQPSEEDMLQSMANWECSLKQETIDSSEYETSETDEEFRKQHMDFPKDSRSRGGAESGITEAYAASAQEYLYETYHDEEEVIDTNYVLSALHESRETMQKMDIHCSEELSPHNELNVEAADLVRNLLSAKIVYRTFKVPVGNADLPLGQAFSIRGYFIPAVGPGYQFITHTPLRQHWRVCPDIHSLRPIIPPLLLLSKEFSRSYANKMEVLQAGDLSICPCITAPCINVLVQDISMYVRPDEDDDDEDDMYDRELQE